VLDDILGKIQVLKNGVPHISSESILVGDVENKPAAGVARAEAETIEIVRAPFSRRRIVEKATAQWNDIFRLDEEVLSTNSNLMSGIDIRFIFRPPAYG